MKKILNLFLIGAMLVSLAFGFAACGGEEVAEPGMTVKYIGGQYTLIKYVQEENVTELTIDKTEDGKQITAIKAGAFDGNEKLTKITVSAGVTEIAQGAFKRMEALEEITLPFVGAEEESVNASRLFGYVFGTDSYEKGNAVTQNYNATATATYYLPETLEKVTITGGAEYAIPAYAFYNCAQLKSVVIGDAAKVGDSAFYNCSYLSDLAIPANVTEIGDEAFVGCNRLKSISFGDNSKLESIGNAAFKGSKMSVITLPAGLKKIGERAFENANIESVTLPAGIEEIPYYAFYGCKRLTKVTLSGTALTRIGEAAFQGCEKLTELADMPVSVKEIAPFAFAECGSLTDAFRAAVEEIGGEFVFGYQADQE